MKRSNSLITRMTALALLLAFGPLQATATFACEMMETVVEETCCCDEAPVARDKADNDECGGEMPSMAMVPCCEHGATVGIDADVLKATPAPKTGNKIATAQFDFDPPNAGIIDTLIVHGLLASRPVAPAVRLATRRPGDGSTLWLTTGRLRI